MQRISRHFTNKANERIWISQEGARSPAHASRSLSFLSPSVFLFFFLSLFFFPLHACPSILLHIPFFLKPDTLFLSLSNYIFPLFSFHCYAFPSISLSLINCLLDPYSSFLPFFCHGFSPKVRNENRQKKATSCFSNERKQKARSEERSVLDGEVF